MYNNLVYLLQKKINLLSIWSSSPINNVNKNVLAICLAELSEVLNLIIVVRA